MTGYFPRVNDGVSSFDDNWSPAWQSKEGSSWSSERRKESNHGVSVDGRHDDDVDGKRMFYQSERISLGWFKNEAEIVV
jgi:hypothetical protein